MRQATKSFKVPGNALMMQAVRPCLQLASRLYVEHKLQADKAALHALKALKKDALRDTPHWPALGAVGTPEVASRHRVLYRETRQCKQLLAG